jgi:hypothetical protein
MSKLSLSGAEITGVIQATVRIVHTNDAAPDKVPVMEWELFLRLQHDDAIPKWALAPQSSDRFKKCELIVQQETNETAHTWTLVNAYVKLYEEVEGAKRQFDEGEAGRFLRLIIRGQKAENTDYNGTNVMTCAKGSPRSDAK